MANTAQTAKATADRIADAGSKAFKDGVDKSLATMADMNVQSKLNIEAVTASVAAATKGAESLGAQVVAYAKKSAEDNTAALRSLSSAKSLQEAIELQTSFAKSAMEAYLAEMTRWSETVSSSVKESMRPLNERTSAVVQQFQTAR
jgi:phasin family protein